MQVTKINSSSITANSFMLKPNFHMNFGKRRIERARKQGLEFQPLGNVVDKVFTGGIFKRVFVDEAEYGLPYISAQHMMNSNPLEVAKIISKKYTPRQDDMSLKENQILISCAGTVGNVKLITKDLEGVIGSQDIIRVDADNNKLLYGYLYAFLSSKTAYTYIQSFIYGSVVPRIEPNTLKKLPIPILSEEFQQKIHNLIVESAQLRIEANKLLKEAVAIMEEKLVSFSTDATSSFKAKNYSVKINLLKAHNNRLDATYNAGWFDWFYSKLEKADIQTRTVSELSHKVFTPNIFKRVRTDNPSLGIPFLSGSDLLSAFPKMDSFLSKRMSNIENYILKNGWLAIQDAGTIGYVTYIHEFLNGVAATNNLIRIIPKEEENYNPYIFTFLKSKIGQKILASFEFGSVQKHIDNHQLSALKIPVISEIYDTITTKTISSMEFFSKACFNEKTAIDLIEKEIDQWQQ